MRPSGFHHLGLKLLATPKRRRPALLTNDGVIVVVLIVSAILGLLWEVFK